MVINFYLVGKYLFIILCLGNKFIHHMMKMSNVMFFIKWLELLALKTEYQKMMTLFHTEFSGVYGIGQSIAYFTPRA